MTEPSSLELYEDLALHEEAKLSQVLIDAMRVNLQTDIPVRPNFIALWTFRPGRAGRGIAGRVNMGEEAGVSVPK